MHITPLLSIGVVLIAVGLLLLWRDMRKKRRSAAQQYEPGYDRAGAQMTFADVEITYPEEPSDQSAVSYLQPARSPLSELRDTIERVCAELTEHDGPSLERSEQVEQDWANLHSRIENAVQALNKVVHDVSVQIGPPGQPGWSCNNHGYGGFRRLMLAGESVAWMRIELTADKRFVCAVRSHGDDKAALNANESITATAMSDNRITGLIGAAIQPITKFAARNASKMMTERDTSEIIWQETEELVMEAMEGASRVLAENGSSLEPIGPAEWDGTTRRHRLTARVMFGGDQVAKMFIDRPTPRHIECLAIPPGGALAELSRRHRIDTNDLSAAKLAELCVTCAWPSIEHAWNERYGHESANG